MKPVQPQPTGGAAAVLAALLEQRTGQQIGSDRSWRLETTLTALMRARGHDRIDSFVGDLIASAEAQLTDQVVDAMLNQETSFFRDPAVLEMVGDALAAKRQANGARRLRAWSAGCSFGQEAVSLAILAAERFGEGERALDIVASDVSETALARARAGRYSQFEIQRGLSIRRMIRWFDGDGDQWSAKPELLAPIAFRRHNLAQDAPLPGRFDVILCRNVFLYFPPALRTQVFERFALALAPGGLLVLGAGETVIGQTDRFRPSPHFRGFYEAVPIGGRRAA